MSIVMVNMRVPRRVSHLLRPINFNKPNWMTTEGSNAPNDIDLRPHVIII